MHIRPSHLLVTIHNLCREDLLAVLRLGGLPAPSLGVTKAGTPFTDFGEISLIGTLPMVDPCRTPVYSRDAYTVSSPKNGRGHPLFSCDQEEALSRMFQPSARRRRGQYDTGRLLADTARRFADMTELRAARRHVVDPAIARALRQDLDDILEQYTPGAVACHRPLHPSSPSSRESSALRALAAARQKGGTAAVLRLELEKRHFPNIPPGVIDAGVKAMGLLQDPRTSYFEAKPQRAVLVAEFAGAVIPAQTPPISWHALREKGLVISAYPTGDARNQALAVKELAWRLACSRSDILYRKLAAALLAGGSGGSPSLMTYRRPFLVFFRAMDATLSHALRLRHGSVSCWMFIALEMPFVIRWGNLVWRKITALWTGS